MKMFLTAVLVIVGTTLLSCSACSDDAKILSGRGEFCSNSGDCQSGLVCKSNLCSKPDEPPTDGDDDGEDSVEYEPESVEQNDTENADQREQEEYNHPLLMPGEKRLSTIGLADGLDPMDIDGNYVVWCHGASGRLFVHCISENWTDELTVEGVDHLCYWASIANGKVYSSGLISYEHSPSAREIFEIDVLSRKHRILNFRDGESYVGLVNARGDYVTWQHSYEGAPQIGLYYLVNDKYKILTSESLTHKTPRLSESHLVWSQLNSAQAGSDIWLYDLYTGGKIRISENVFVDSIYRIDASVDDGYAAWNSVNQNTVERYIWVYNISNKQSNRLESSGSTGGPWVKDKRVYWNEETSLGYRVRGMDISTNEYFWITDERWEGSQGSPKVSGRWLIYSDSGRFPPPDWSSMGDDVILFDLCTLDHFKNEDMCK